MPIDIPQLRTELQTDPNAYGYDPHRATGADWQLAELINRVRAGVDIDRDIVAAYEVYEAMVAAEYDALTAAKKERVRNLLSMGQLNAKGANTRNTLLDCFAPGTTTRTNLAAMQKRSGSRAEFLWGANVVVTVDQVAQARGAGW